MANSQQHKDDGLLLFEGLKKTLNAARQKTLKIMQYPVENIPIPPGKNWRDIRLTRLGF